MIVAGSGVEMEPFFLISYIIGDVASIVCPAHTQILKSYSKV